MHAVIRMIRATVFRPSVSLCLKHAFIIMYASIAGSHSWMLRLQNKRAERNELLLCHERGPKHLSEDHRRLP